MHHAYRSVCCNVPAPAVIDPFDTAPCPQCGHMTEFYDPRPLPNVLIDSVNRTLSTPEGLKRETTPLTPQPHGLDGLD